MTRSTPRFHTYLLALAVLFCIGIVCPTGLTLAQDNSPTQASHRHVVSKHKSTQHKPGHKSRHPGMSGVASYYGAELHGNKTSSGRHYDMHAMTAAHRTLPLGTWVKVTNRRNGRSVVVQITDRGPFTKKRIIDVSLSAATKLGMRNSGLAPVTLEVVPRPTKDKSKHGHKRRRK